VTAFSRQSVSHQPSA